MEDGCPPSYSGISDGYASAADTARYLAVYYGEPEGYTDLEILLQEEGLPSYREVPPALDSFESLYSRSVEAFRAYLLVGDPHEALAEALSGFKEGVTHENFGVEYLAGFLKQGEQMEEEELARYALTYDLSEPLTNWGHTFTDRYFDAEFNFCLTHGRDLIASVGFNAEDGRMYLCQIQGEPGKKEQLRPVKWERALVGYAVEWAREYDIGKVVIQSVKNNTWLSVDEHRRAQGYMLYDVTAKRMGFKKDEDGNYVKRLHPSGVSSQ